MSITLTTKENIMRISKTYEYDEKDLQLYKEELIDLFEKLQKDFGTEKTRAYQLVFDFDKSRFSGWCVYNQKQIRINEYRMIEFLSTNDKTYMLTVLIHEFCHALAGEESNICNHSFNFHSLNVLLYSFYGYSPDHSHYNYKEEDQLKLVNPGFLYRYARLYAKYMKNHHDLFKLMSRLDARFTFQNEKLMKQKMDRHEQYVDVMKIQALLIKDRDKKIKRMEEKLSTYKAIENRFYIVIALLSMLSVPTVFKLI